MKKNGLKLLLALLCTAILGITGCSDGGSSGSDSGNNNGGGTNSDSEWQEETVDYDVSADGTISTFSNGKIIKNKVINEKTSDVYYEYLSFTSETGGTYEIYKYDSNATSENNKYTKEASLSIDGTTVTVPESFTYEATTGKVTTTKTDNSSTTEVASVYFVTTGTTNWVSTYLLTTTGTDSSSLFNKWTVSNDSSVKTTFTFEDNGSLYIGSTGSSSDLVFYANNNGIISINSLTEPVFLWTKINNSMSLYGYAYKAERSEVAEVGRSVISLNSNEISFETGKFLLVK